MKYASIGTISHATLRSEDLLQAFADELEYQVQRNAEEWTSEDGRARRDKYLELMSEARDIGEDGHPDYESEEASELVNELQDALNDFAGPYCYFGSTEGDGSDFGFWPSIDDINELPCYEDTDAAKAAGETDDFRTVTDHGNVTVWGADGTEVLSIV